LSPSETTSSERPAADPAAGDTCLPPVLGVTGHRDLRAQDLPRLEELVRGIFTDLQKHYPATPLLLSPLAEGAYRLAARVALERGVSRVVLPREEYEKDFETLGSRSEFADLLWRIAQPMGRHHQQRLLDVSDVLRKA
jgi:hypothetical protein